LTGSWHGEWHPAAGQKVPILLYMKGNKPRDMVSQLQSGIARAGAILFCALALPLAAQDEPPAGLNGGRLDSTRTAQPPRPTPHWPDGRVNLGPLPGEKGVWEGNAGSTLATNIGRGIDNPRMNLPTNLKISEVPFQPWARALYDYRQSATTKDAPHTKCLPSGGPAPVSCALRIRVH